MGPLAGLKIVEFAGLGPGPFAAMMMADMGADVLRIDKMNSKGVLAPDDPSTNLLARGRRSVGLDLKNPQGLETALKLVDQADALIEGYRPGVMERIGVGPDVCMARNPKLVYGRMTGWGQDGPMANAAGHDINYISLTGALAAIGRADTGPVPPLNLIGDFGGGGMLLSFGLVCALLEARQSGKGQIVDAAMTDGSALLMTGIFGFFEGGKWSAKREDNILDGAAPFYGTYECSDGEWLSVGSIEPQFYDILLDKLGMTDEQLGDRWDQSLWPQQRQTFADAFRQKTLKEWCDLMEGSDICFAPILSMGEAVNHPHNVARKTFVTNDGVRQPAPAPRFSRTPPELGMNAQAPGSNTREALGDWGLSAGELDALTSDGAIQS